MKTVYLFKRVWTLKFNFEIQYKVNLITIINTIPSCLGILASGSPSVPFDMAGSMVDAVW